MNSRKVKLFSRKTFIIPLITVIFIFIFMGYFIVKSINDSFYLNMAEDSKKFAEVNKNSLSRTMAANKIIEELIEEKLMAAGKTILKNQKNISNDLLKEMADELNIDKAYWYDSSGVIIYTANDYLGWQTKTGDPTYDFMKGSESFSIDPIRPDEDSGIYMKFAQFKAEDGEMLQIAILADDYTLLTREFCPKDFIDLLSNEEDILHIHFLNNEGDVLICNDETKRSQYELDDAAKDAIKANMPYYGKRFHEGIETFETLIPVYVDGLKVGTLATYYSLENTNALAHKIVTLVVSFLCLILFIYTALMIKISNDSKKITRLAYYDINTNVFNKNYLEKFLNEEHKNNKGKDAFYILFYENLNLLESVSGEEKKENMLKKHINKIKKLNVFNAMFRNYEDSFLLYTKNCKNKDELLRNSKKVVDCFDETMEEMKFERNIDIKIGIIEWKQKYKEGERVVIEREQILSAIKELSSKRYFYFDDSVLEELLTDKKIKIELNRATENNFAEGFYLEYQPQVDLNTNKIVGLEALARWKNEKLGQIPPSKFIGIAEKHQMMIPLGEWIMKETCRFKKMLEDNGLKDIILSMNISAVQLLEESFKEKFNHIINEAGINAETLRFEITESLLMNNYDVINKKLDSLRQKGIKIYLDDFGTGYSSLSRLQKLDIDVLKIDKSFIDDILNPDQDSVIIENIIRLANELNLATIAEGVETEEQREYLIEKKCSLMQGFLFSKPISSQKVIELIEATNSGAHSEIC